MPSIEELTRGLDDQLPEPYPGLTYGARQRHCHRAAQVVAGHRQREAAPPAERSGVSAIAGSGKPTGAATITLAIVRQAETPDNGMQRPGSEAISAQVIGCQRG